MLKFEQRTLPRLQQAIQTTPWKRIYSISSLYLSPLSVLVIVYTKGSKVIHSKMQDRIIMFFVISVKKWKVRMYIIIKVKTEHSFIIVICRLFKTGFSAVSAGA